MRYRMKATTVRAVAAVFATSMLLTACDVATVEEYLADIMGGAPEAAAQLDDGATNRAGVGSGAFMSPTAADHAAARADDARTPSGADDARTPSGADEARTPASADDQAAASKSPPTADDPAPSASRPADDTPSSSTAADDAGEPAPSPDDDADTTPATTRDADPNMQEPAPRRSDTAAPETARAPTPAGDAGPAALAAIEQQVHELLTAERAQAGLEPLQLDRALSQGARAWSRRMATENFFSHDGSGDFAENIAFGYPTPQAVHDGWMDSKGHHANRMDTAHTSYGVGVYKRGTTIYYTERFR